MSTEIIVAIAGLVGFIIGWILTGKIKSLEKCPEHYMLRFVVSAFSGFTLFMLVAVVVRIVSLAKCQFY